MLHDAWRARALSSLPRRAHAVHRAGVARAQRSRSSSTPAVPEETEMNRRDFLKSGAAAAASTVLLNRGTRALAQQPAHVYDRPLHFVYANGGGLCFPYSVQQLMAFFDQVPRGVTALNPFFLNVRNPSQSQYQDMLAAVSERNIAIIPGVGEDPRNGIKINDSLYKSMAQAVRPYTSYIRLENMQGFYDLAGGQAPIQDMIDFCANTLGFRHIMLNPWPKNGNDVVEFANPQIDASFNQVFVDWDRNNYVVKENPDNWKVNMTAVNRILKAYPQTRIVVNYESAPQHELLAHLSQADQEAAFNITANQCRASSNLFWCAPFTQVYDPVVHGTWAFESNLLDQQP
jgi:hypothetical protein